MFLLFVLSTVWAKLVLIKNEKISVEKNCKKVSLNEY
jgi:hypothetical protein